MADDKNKKPPFHEIILKVLNGDYEKQEEVESYVDDWVETYLMALLLAYSHVPEEPRQDLTKAMISSLIRCNGDADARTVCALAVNEMGTKAIVEKALDEISDHGKKEIIQELLFDIGVE